MSKAYFLDDDIGFVEMIAKHGSPGLSVVNSARCSYASESEEFEDKDQKLVKYLWNAGHTSPFRHFYYTFHLKIPLMTMRQIVKYQVASTWRTFEARGEEVSLETFDHFFDTDSGTSWNEVSGRYVQLKPEFYIPQKMRANVVHGSKQASTELDWDEKRHEGYRDIFKKKVERDYQFYQDCLTDGIARELARAYLPTAIYSQAYWTVSLQGILFFLSQRAQPEAQFEIRKCALAIYSLIKDDLDELGISFESIVNQ